MSNYKFGVCISVLSTEVLKRTKVFQLKPRKERKSVKRVNVTFLNHSSARFTLYNSTLSKQNVEVG